MPSSAATKQQQATSATHERRKKVVSFPGKPRRRVNVTFGGQGRPYRYSIGDDGFDRAVYQGEAAEETDAVTWVYRAPLPYVHARVVRRDGSQRRIGTDYLISATSDSPRVIVTDQ